MKLLRHVSTTDSKEGRRREKGKEDILHASSTHNSSYFEIPTKDGHMANNGIHEIPTKDTEGNSTHTTTGKIYFSIHLINRKINLLCDNNHKNFAVDVKSSDQLL